MTNPQGGGKGGGGGGGPTSTPAPPQKKWYDGVPRHGAKFDKESDWPRQTIMVNPRNHLKVGPNGREDYQNNCTRVSATWILRRFFGMNVTAGMAPWKDPQTGKWKNPSKMRHDDGTLYGGGDWYTEDIVNKWIDPKTGQQREQTQIPTKIDDPTAPNGERYMTNEEWIHKVRKMILAENPEGSGGFMRITGHIFNWEIKGGRVRFIEAQSQPYPWRESYNEWDKDWQATNSSDPWWKSKVDPSDKLNWYMRVDDLEPKKELFDDGWVHVVTIGERDAPFFDDMILQGYARYPEDLELRNAFREGWNQVRQGRKPRMPNGWGGTSRESAYRAGVEYARKPN